METKRDGSVHFIPWHWLMLGLLFALLPAYADEMGPAERFNQGLSINLKEMRDGLQLMNDGKKSEKMLEDYDTMRKELETSGFNKERTNIYLELYVYLAELMEGGVTDQEFVLWKQAFVRRKAITAEEMISLVTANPAYNKPNPFFYRHKQ